MVTMAVAMVRPLGIGRLLSQSAWSWRPRRMTAGVWLMSSRRCGVTSVISNRNGVGGAFRYARRVTLRECLGFEIRPCVLSGGGGGGEKGGKIKGNLILGIETRCDDTGAGVVSTGGAVLGEALVSQVQFRSRWQDAKCELPFRSRCVRDVGGVCGISVFEEFIVPVRVGFRHLTTKNWAQDSDEDPDDEEQSDSRSKVVSKGSEKVVRWHVDKLCPTSLRVKQIKEWDYDDIIEREKKLKIVIRIKELLVAEPSRSMTLQDLGKCRDYIGLTGGRRIIAFLKKFPAVFKLHETVENGKLPWCCLTPEAEAICEEELEVRKGMKVELLTKLRKLLMMSSNRRLLLVKIAHLAQDLGLPDDFRKSFVYKYPKYIRVVDSEDVTNDEGRLLELVKWSHRLAVTEADRKAQEMVQESSPGSPPKYEIQLPRRYRLSDKDKYVLYKFHELECPSPYQDSSHLDPASAEAEKRAVLIVKELLSLTLEKRLFVDHLTHFRKEYRFSNQMRQVLIRHPEHFYISKKGARNTVFLREAFEGVHVPRQRQEHILKDKHPLVLVKEKLAALMAVKQVSTASESMVPSQEDIESFKNCEVFVQDANSPTPEMATAVST